MITIKISNCQKCPFCNWDNSLGAAEGCNLAEFVLGKWNEEMPKDGVHEDCPLKKNKYTIELI